MALWRPTFTFVSTAVLLLITKPATAQFAVIDVGAIVQLIQQVVVAEEQLTTARDHLTQAKAEFDSITGGRGMELLLMGIERNYLPPSWIELKNVMDGAAGAYGGLSASLRALVEANAVLTPEMVALLSPEERAQLESARHQAALLQVTSREALDTTSVRFDAIQELIAAIPAAADQKGILDLQARIAAENAMLQNEQTKLNVLDRSIEAERQARAQRLREEAIAGIGSLKDLPPLGL